MTDNQKRNQEQDNQYTGTSAGKQQQKKNPDHDKQQGGMKKDPSFNNPSDTADQE